MVTSNPRSSAVRSSDIAHNTFHRQSISDKYPRQIGDDALIANLNRQKKRRKIRISLKNTKTD
jgi:hypothetical protein